MSTDDAPLVPLNPQQVSDSLARDTLARTAVHVGSPEVTGSRTHPPDRDDTKST